MSLLEGRRESGVPSPQKPRTLRGEAQEIFNYGISKTK